MKRAWAESVARMGLAAGSVLAAFLIVELLLRVFGFATTGSFYQLDPVTGHAFRPGARGWLRQEGEAYIEINDDGLRGPPVPKEPPRERLRIAVLGDSYAAGLQVPFDQTFGSVLQRELASSCAPNAEVIGFGVPDYGTAQELFTLRERVWPYSPNIVVLAFHTGNDVRNNSRNLEPNPNRPYFTLDAGGLTLDDAFRDWQKRRGPYYAVVSRSVLLQQLDHLPANLRAIRRPDAERGLDELIYGAPPNTDWAEAWAITEALLLKIGGEVEERAARLLVVTLSNGIQVHPDPSVRRAFAERLGVGDLFYTERRLSDFGERHGLSVLSLAPAFQRHAEERKVFLHGFDEARPGRGHWNERGHALAGELVARRLCQDLPADLD
jgi:hypothetical protein